MRSYFLLLLLAMAGLVVAFTPLPVPVIAPLERTFRIDARQFAYSPGEGDIVAIIGNLSLYDFVGVWENLTDVSRAILE